MTTEALQTAIFKLIDETADLTEAMKNITGKLSEEVPVFNWVGFYLPNPEKENELVIGPYVGDYTDHTHIPYGRGVCGQVALSKETMVVDDVSKEANYLSCSINVKSEIVAPILKNGEFVGQLDIDSHTINGITPELKDLCEAICEKMAERYWD